MKIKAICAECGAHIKTIKLRQVQATRQWTDEDLEETQRDIDEQSRAGFLRLFCKACNKPVNIETIRGTE
jgi:hypothetical protein